MNIHPCSVFIADQDLSHMADDEAYDYKFVKWMIKEKVRIPCHETHVAVVVIAFFLSKQ